MAVINMNPRARDAGKLPITIVERIWATSSFAKSLGRHSRNTRLLQSIDACVDRLFTNHRSPGLNLEKLGGGKSRSFWSVRVDGEARLILVPVKQTEIALVHVDHHQAAYRWTDEHASRAESVLSEIADVPRHGSVEQLIGQVGVPSEADVVRAIDSLTQFRHMMDRGVDTYFTSLDERQRDLVDMNPATPFLVLGGPGTGKTVIAVHRLVRRVAEKTDQPLLYLCFNRPLAQAVRQMAEALANGPLPSHIEIMTMHDWCERVMAISGRKIPLLPGTLNGPTQDSLRQLTYRHFGRLPSEQKSALGGRDGRFVHEETSAVMKQSNVTLLEDYLEIDRGWRGGSLGERARHVIWSVWEMVRAELSDKGIADWDDLPRLALDSVISSPNPVGLYQEIIIDEVQDATPAIIDLCRRHLPQTGAGLFAFGDPVQRLYNRPFRAIRDAIAPTVTTRRWITKDYRTTQQIWNLAKAWRVVDQARDDVAEADIDPDRPGPAPKLFIEKTSRDAMNALIDAVVETASQMNAGLIGITYLGDTVGIEISKRLTDRMVASTIIDGRTEMLLGAPTVKLMTMRRSKGLDFPTVFMLMPACPDRSRDPITWQDNALSDDARRVFYVAATRASRSLTIFSSDSDSHPLLGALDPSTYVVAGTGGQLWRNRHGGDDALDGIEPDLLVAPNGERPG